MNNKKGFTLVELIAVIALLAVILLLIVPNVIDVLKQGRRDAFVDQIHSVIKNTEKQYGIDVSLSQLGSGVYCSGTDLFSNNRHPAMNTSLYSSTGLLAEAYGYDYYDGPCKPLELNLNAVRYITVVDSYGRVAAIGIQDKNYCYAVEYPTADVDYDSIVKGGQLTCNERYCSCGDDNEIYIGYIRANDHNSDLMR